MIISEKLLNFSGGFFTQSYHMTLEDLKYSAKSHFYYINDIFMMF